MRPSGKILFILLSAAVFSGAVNASSGEPYYSVKEVIDGDTVVLDNGQTVRYLGIDTPERDEPFYLEAKKRNRELVRGKKIRLEVCREEPKDRYGRTLAWVFAEDTFVNRALLAEGFARKLIIPPCGLPRKKEFEKLENEAKLKQIGLWKAFFDLPVITPEEASAHAGERIRVKGMAVEVFRSENAVFINMTPEGKKGFTAVILKKDFHRFGDEDFASYEGREITVTGAVSIYKGRPEIVLTEPAQIEINQTE